MKSISLNVGLFLSTLLLPTGGSVIESRNTNSATPIAARKTDGKQSDTLFSATEWKTCEDLPELQCRKITVPRFYTLTKVIQGNVEGNLVNLERRLVKEKPTRHVWLLQEGPCTSSTIVAIILAQQLAKALKTDYIIQVPLITAFAVQLLTPEYSAYSANLTSYLQSQTVPIEAYSSVNIAGDIIASVEHEKSLEPGVPHYVHVLSYANEPLNEILLQKPDLFCLAILDGVCPPLPGARSLFKLQGLGLGNLALDLGEDCARSTHCRSLSINRLIDFRNGLSQGKSTPCFDTFTKALNFTGSKDVVFDILTTTIFFLFNNPVPIQLFRGKKISVESVLPQILKWYQGDKSDLSLIEFDNRVAFWALANHLAQCISASSSVFTKLLPTAIGPFLEFAQNLNGILGSPEIGLSPTNFLLENYIIYHESDSPEWDPSSQLAAQENTFIRYTNAFLIARAEMRKALTLYIDRNPVITVPATGIKADLYFVNGVFDPNTPLHCARTTFEDLQVAKGHTKTFAQFNHAGHVVFIGN